MTETGRRRWRAIVMTPAEGDELLSTERTCRVATVSGNGSPHVAPLWFVRAGAALWLNSLTRGQRWTDLQRDPGVSVVVDAGTGFADLRGVEISSRAEVVGEVWRGTDPTLTRREEQVADKSAGPFAPDGQHAWSRITSEKQVGWDFRKDPALRAVSA